MLAAALLSFGVVFLAELGDRSQVIAMTYALRYRWWVVLTGVGIGACVAHGASVAIGHFLGLTLPARPTAFASAIAFLAFAVLTWREGTNGGGDVGPVREPRFGVLAVLSSFLLAELGDKTTLATIALASDKNWAGVWIGTTVAMVVGDGLAIAAGLLLHRRLPQRLLHTLASLLFLLCGLWMLFDGALGWHWVAIGATMATALAAATVAATRSARRPATEPAISEPSRGAA